MRETASLVDAPTLPAMLRARAGQTPQATAFVVPVAGGGTQVVTWEQFLAKVEAVAASLAGLGLGKGDRVGILAATSLEWEIAQMAALACGALVAGIDPNYADDQLNDVIGGLRLRALFAGDAAMLARIAPVHRPGLGLIVLLGSDAQDADDPLHRLQDLERTASSPGRALPRVESSDPALVTFSSGTTGRPKPIAYTHEQVLLAVRTIVTSFPDVGEGSRLICWLPLANLFQRMINFCAIATGATTYVLGDPRQVMTHLPSARPHLFIGVPRFFERVRAGVDEQLRAQPKVVAALVRWAMRQGERRARAASTGGEPGARLALSSGLADRLALRRLRSIFGGEVKYLVSGSAPMPYWLLEWFDGLGLPVYEAYGLSENVVPIAMNRPGARRLGTVGKPLPPNDVTLTTEGEILVRGRGVFRGYMDAGAAAPAPDSSGFWATGDLGSFDGDGFLRVTGRKADEFKTSTGRWVSPARIEERLRRLPYVQHALAVGAGRKAVAAILSIDRAAVASADRGAPAKAGPATHDRDRDMLHRTIQRDLAPVVDDLPAHERPAGVLVVGEAFSIAGGELTTNLKLRRAAVTAKYATHIDRLYAALEGREPRGPQSGELLVQHA